MDRADTKEEKVEALPDSPLTEPKEPEVRSPGDARPIPAPKKGSQADLASPDYYLNRELSWLSFNFRVLCEARDPRTPLLERVKFLSIVGSNLDEFIMKRIGGLKLQVGVGISDRTVDGRTPQEQIDECLNLIRELKNEAATALLDIKQALSNRGIVFRDYADLDEAAQAELRERYIENVFPLVTPQATDPAHPFPFVSNLSLNLLVTLRYPSENLASIARVKVPIGAWTPRFQKLAEADVYVPLEGVMAGNLDLLFPGMVIESCELFRVTRNANTALDEERADDLLAMIEGGLRERKFAPIVRLEVAEGMNPEHRGMLAAELGLDEQTDVVEVADLMAPRDLMEIARINQPELHDAPHRPIDHPVLRTSRNIFHILRDRRHVLLHHPYESFANSVERLLREASQDPKVLAIKMTLYRTSEDTKVLQHLIDAARNGKQVAVVVELKARFDEAANIRWASRMEEVGIHVTYGVVGLKTHCKAILVVRQDYNGLKRYAHVGTGNYHAGTARLYSDLSLLTADEDIGADLTELFNYLTTGYKPKRDYRKILPAPKILKPALLSKIDREITVHSKDDPGLIRLKMNALEDADVTRALYRAAAAGVRIDLIIRDSCRIRPGIPGVTDNLTVISIVGRFLEHTRIYYFKNGGDEEFYIGSADAMKRNLESRVEILVPVEGADPRRDLRRIFEVQLKDDRSAWEMQSDGSYVQRRPEKGSKGLSSQEALMELAARRLHEATRLRKRRPRGPRKMKPLN